MNPTDDRAALSRRFGAEMVRGIRELAREGYNANYFRQMLATHGPVEAARRLVLDPTPSEGLWRLQQMDRLDMSVEMWVQLPWYQPLFEPEVREQARKKLEALRVDVPTELARLVGRLDPDGER
ncbi:hypothetical protein [Actinophytocola sp.]|uniref:hypothetical protein n=1 Tax=Actinophytocola sp. TaxID=1872138 RepID=UPI00389A5DC4